ncbi:replication initiation protein [Clostridium estertheticum]|uniref:replication initiation protein n=1 Tax=Clostridium estertheticum TaxID=238834 RepID=UPI001C0C5BFF|nr:RepB family plasmid replication initiator protein [Clostridium estertheticum]MBU3174423.1 RepB family plasmid replication initiator protein [Clostridium estertheticum]
MENKKGGDLICRRPETITEARFSLTKRQNDILDIVFSSIEHDNKLRYEIDINKYESFYNIKDKSNIYRDFKKAVNSFELKGFSVTTKNEKGKEHRVYFSWFASIEYIDGESKIILELGARLKELMLCAKQACFYQIKYSLNFKSIYSQRIYYYLKRFEDTGFRIDSLDELRTKLNCPKSYNLFSNFRLYVLDPAFREINDNSDISFKYEEIKKKGKITSIKFYIRKSNKVNKKAIDEVCTTKEGKYTNKEEKCNTEPINAVRSILKEDISGIEAKSILDTAKGDINIIKEKYEIVSQMKKVDSVVATMISAIKSNYQAPKGKEKVGSFNDYEQRAYDFDELEKKLLRRENKVEVISENFDETIKKMRKAMSS